MDTLSKNRKKLSANELLSLIPGHVYWKDIHGVYLGCNEELARTVGLNSPDDIVDKVDYDLMDTKTANIIVKADSQIMKNGKSRVFEEVGFAADGSDAVYLTKKTPIRDEDGKVTGLFGVSIDITAYKKTEQAIIEQHEQKEMTLGKVISLMPGNVYWKDKNGICLGCNDNMLKILGLKSSDEYIGKTDYELLDKATAERTVKIDKKVMEKNSPKSLEEEGYDANGNPAVYLTQKIPLHDAKKQVVGVLGISIDITDRKKMEKELEKAKDKAEIANRLKSDFIRNMEHDIRTPSSGIMRMLEILEKQERESNF